MSSCLPFMLLSSSIPLTLQSNISDPGFQNLAADQRPDSRLSGPRPATIDIQPSRTPSPTDDLQRDRRRVPNLQHQDIPRSVPTLRRQRSRNFRNKRAGPSVPELPAIHEQWIGTRQDSSNGHIRRISDPVRNSTPMVGLDELPLSSRRSSDPPSARSSTTLPSIRLSLGSRFSTASTLAPSVPSPALRSDNRNSLMPPLPPLSTLEEDIVLRLPEARRAVAALRTLEEDVVDTNSAPQSSCDTDLVPPSPSLNGPDNDANGVSGVSPRRRASKSKSVSFSTDVPQIILSPDNILEDNKPLRRQSSWSGLFLISAPPVAAKPSLARQTSMPTVRGQAAGKSCLKRTSSFQDDSLMAEPQHKPLSSHVIRRKSLPKSRSGRAIRSTSPPPQLSIPPLLEFPPIDISTVIIQDATSEDARSDRTYEKRQTESNVIRNSGQTIIVTPRPRKPEPTLSLEQKAVRHWSMTGNGWIRRSGIYAGGSGPVPAARDAPPVPRLPINVDMIRV
ncbi:hypothetical protein BDV96DRAFT_596060 [Lophiotrema nucula]|uniref:Uncharacterized protein n=1 Tax=Lophiotrema nucula TaxID=690887 RepID=A0A6A5ZM50_9PLEO|nr:hypothetical protein BDV96DRAFT_596060 [Lophiotrema nucula]